jgi:hypothetical protein
LRVNARFMKVKQRFTALICENAKWILMRKKAIATFAGLVALLSGADALPFEESAQFQDGRKGVS